MKKLGIIIGNAALSLVLLTLATNADEAPLPEIEIDARPFVWEPSDGNGRAILGHVSQADIEAGIWSNPQLIEAGRRLFLANFTHLDGAGRPGATGDGTPTRRPLGSGERFVRTAGPDANACSSCHRRPSIGGAGDFTTNVFSGLGARHPIFRSIDPRFSSERDTPDLYGSGVIELLAREMTQELHQIRNEAILEASRQGKPVRRDVVAKGISFGSITANMDGSLHLGDIEGIDRDLVVRPWGQKGTITSIRTFSVTASNLHHGMQAEERFGLHLTGSDDFDRDGIVSELTDGDITAMSLFQAAMPLPGRVLPHDHARQAAVARGEELFNGSPCAECHIPALPLDSVMYSEPGPYNLEGTLRDAEVDVVVSIDLTRDTRQPRLAPEADGRILVRLFSDLKRHRISDDERPHFGNESLVEGLTSTDEFLTRRLWTVGNTNPYGHRGDLTTIAEAIDMHGGEARTSRLWFERQPDDDRTAILAFLHSLQALPDGSPPVVYEARPIELPYSDTGNVPSKN